MPADPTHNPPTSGRTNRRRFLRETTLGSFFLASARFVPGTDALHPLPEHLSGKLLFFSAEEYRIMAAAADRFVGPAPQGGMSASDLDAALRADIFLAGADPEIQEQIHLLLTVFNHPVFTFLFDLRLSAFVNLASADQDDYIRDWMTSPLPFRRTAFVALKRLCMSMYYTEPRSWQEIGYDGVFAL